MQFLIQQSHEKPLVEYKYFEVVVLNKRTKKNKNKSCTDVRKKKTWSAEEMACESFDALLLTGNIILTILTMLLTM